MWTSSDCSSCSRASVTCRSVRSRTKPVKKRWSLERISPTASSIGKVEPSLRSPTTTRPMPMMRRSPVVEVAREVAVVRLAVGRRHQHLDVLADHLGRGVAEQPLGRRAERTHDAVLVDDDHRVGDGVEDRLQMGLARRAGRGCGRRPRARLRRSRSPNHAMPTPTTAKATTSMMSGAPRRPADVEDDRADEAERRWRTGPGPRPPQPLASSTAGTNRTRSGRSSRTGPSSEAQRRAIAATASDGDGIGPSRSAAGAVRP